MVFGRKLSRAEKKTRSVSSLKRLVDKTTMEDTFVAVRLEPLPYFRVALLIAGRTRSRACKCQPRLPIPSFARILPKQACPHRLRTDRSPPPEHVSHMGHTLLPLVSFPVPSIGNHASFVSQRDSKVSDKRYVVIAEIRHGVRCVTTPIFCNCRAGASFALNSLSPPSDTLHGHN